MNNIKIVALDFLKRKATIGELRRAVKGADTIINYCVPKRNKIELTAGWFEPVCPFCHANIPAPTAQIETVTDEMEFYPEGSGKGLKPGDKILVGYDWMHCSQCGATYSFDPDCDNEDAQEAKAGLERKGPTKTFIYHCYDIGTHTFNNMIDAMVDLLEPNMGLGHLWFVTMETKHQTKGKKS